MFKKAKWHKAVKKAKTERQKLTKRLDDLWSLVVRQRANHTCVKCGRVVIPGSGNAMNAHHLIGKGSRSTRWDLENGICLCAGCHRMKTDAAHRQPEKFKKWVMDEYGIGWYANMVVKGNQIKKWTIPELEELLETFKKEIKEYEDN